MKKQTTIITEKADISAGSVTAFIDKNTGEVYKPAFMESVHAKTLDLI